MLVYQQYGIAQFGTLPLQAKLTQIFIKRCLLTLTNNTLWSTCCPERCMRYESCSSSRLKRKRRRQVRELAFVLWSKGGGSPGSNPRFEFPFDHHVSLAEARRDSLRVSFVWFGRRQLLFPAGYIPTFPQCQWNYRAFKDPSIISWFPCSGSVRQENMNLLCIEEQNECGQGSEIQPEKILCTFFSGNLIASDLCTDCDGRSVGWTVHKLARLCIEKLILPFGRARTKGKKRLFAILIPFSHSAKNGKSKISRRSRKCTESRPKRRVLF